MTFDQQTARPTAWVVCRHPWLRLQQVRHDHCDLARRVKLPGTLALAFGEFPQQLFECAAKDVRFHVVEAEPVFGIVEHLDQVRQVLIVYNALSRCRGVEVRNINNAGKSRILTGDRTNGVGEELPQAGGCRGDLRPARLFGNVEAHQFVILLDQFRSGSHITEVVGEMGKLVIEDIGEPLEEDQGKNISP